MSEPDLTRQKRLLDELHKSRSNFSPELARFADAVWNQAEDSLTHEECLAALPTYVSAEVAGRDVAALYPAIKRHLDHCDECGPQYAELLELSLAEADALVPKLATTPDFDLSFLPTRRAHKPPKPAAWREKIPALVAQLQKIILTPNVALAAHAATAAEPEQGHLADNSLYWSVAESAEQNLVIYLTSFDLSLEGLRLELRAEDWRADAVLEPVAQDQVGAKVIMPQQERARQSKATTMRIQFASDQEANE